MSEVKAKQLAFAKMTKDPSKAKTPDGFYYHAHNIRFIASVNEINGGFHFEKGNNILLQIPRPQLNYGMKAITYKVNTYDANGNQTGAIDKSVIYDVEFQSTNPYGLPRNQIERQCYTGSPQTYYVSKKQTVLGYAIATKGVVLISTDNDKFDCVWLVKIQDNSFDIELLYMRNMGLRTTHPLEIINNYENEKVDKIYWVDNGLHQLRHLNLEQKISNGDYNNLIDMDVNLIEAVSSVGFSQPKIVEINYGGTHTAGMIQYAYVLYKLNGSQTMLSPVSELIPLGKGDTEGGGEVNEIVGTSPTIRIEGIDTKYDNILVYAIKYTTYNGVPSVAVIEDSIIPNNGVIEIYDDGSIISNATIEEIKLLNNSLNFPGTITSKDNSLFHANYKENNFEVKLDVRAYQFPANPDHSARVYSNIYQNTQGEIVGDIRDIHSVTTGNLVAYTDDPEDTFDNINLGYDYYMYQGNRTTRGGEGKYLKFEFKSDTTNNGTRRYLKDNEIYRGAIHFYNIFGQTTLPMWFADFKAPQGNLEGKPNILSVTLKPEFYAWLNSQNLDIYSKPVGYKILIAERTNSDKTILASGLINPMMINNSQPISGKFHELYDNDHRIRVIPSKFNELDEILRTKVKSPNPAFRNAWLDPSKTDFEILTHRPEDVPTSWNTLITRLIDTPLQKAAHYRNLNSTLLKAYSGPSGMLGATVNIPGDTLAFKFLTEFPSSKDKPDRFWHYQDSKTMQLYCPEAIFGSIPVLPEDCTLNVRYAYKNTENYVWERMIHPDGLILMDGKIKNRLAVTVNAENSSVNNVDWMNQGSPAGWYNNMVHLSQPENKVHVEQRPLPFGWARSGMFSNYWGDSFGDVKTEHVTKLQLFYRRYGYTREESVKGNLNYFPGKQDLQLQAPTSPSENIISGYNNNLSSITVTEALIEEFPTLETVTIKTVFNNLGGDYGPGNAITFTTGLNGAIVETLSLSESFTSYSNEVTINKADININNSILNGITVNNTSGFNDLNGVVGYDVTYVVKNASGTELLNQTSFNSANYSVSPIGNISGGISQPVIKSDHIIKPNQTGIGTTSYEIYGRPIFTKRGASSKDYNGNGYFKFNNTLRNVGSNHLGGTHGADKTVLGINSEGSQAITFVLNPNAKNDNKLAISFENLIENAKFKTNNFRTNVGSAYAEIVKSRKDIYLGGIYGGNSYEDKKRTNYLEVGEYSDITVSSTTVYSPGDTYVQDFRFLRISRGEMSKLSHSYIEHEEILEYLTETTIDLLNRNDKSFSQWDSDFSYSDPVYHKYNRVYSQQNKITLTKDLEYSFKPVNYFNASVRGSRKKINGELVDSWLQPMVNDAIDLDGKYGPINRLINFNDNVFAMQERGISMLSINPKVQINTVEAGALQLGTGKLLDSYKYVSTTKGSLKWNCISTEVGIFFVDIFDKSINLLSDGIKDLTTENGFKKYGIDNIVYDDYKRDNPILKEGISIGYDNTRGDIYFTFAKDDNSFTLGYNISQNGFSSFYDYNSSIYFPYKGEMYSINPSDQGEVYQFFAGKYNYFYKQNKESVFEFIASPEPLTEVTFNNLEYKDEASNVVDNSEVIHTFETIKVSNEFQDSGIIQLKPKFNIRKLNRKWRLNIPRSSNKVNRIRNNWAKIKLQSNNTNSYNHKIEDIILYYNPNYKIIK